MKRQIPNIKQGIYEIVLVSIGNSTYLEVIDVRIDQYMLCVQTTLYIAYFLANHSYIRSIFGNGFVIEQVYTIWSI